MARVAAPTADFPSRTDLMSHHGQALAMGFAAARTHLVRSGLSAKFIGETVVDVPVMGFTRADH